ncbi:hypothetical protein ACRRTK_021420 [Alexandromys fortis]
MRRTQLDLPCGKLPQDRPQRFQKPHVSMSTRSPGAAGQEAGLSDSCHYCLPPPPADLELAGYLGSTQHPRHVKGLSGSWCTLIPVPG